MKVIISIVCLFSLSSFADVWKKPDYKTDENHPPVSIPSVSKEAQEESPEEIQKDLEDEKKSLNSESSDDESSDDETSEDERGN
jgi:hypothetical protein